MGVEMLRSRHIQASAGKLHVSRGELQRGPPRGDGAACWRKKEEPLHHHRMRRTPKVLLREKTNLKKKPRSIKSFAETPPPPPHMYNDTVWRPQLLRLWGSQVELLLEKLG